MKKSLIFIALIVVAIAISLAVYLTDTPVSKSRIERITGVEFPDYEIKKEYNGRQSFNGDNKNRYQAEFSEMPSDEFYNKLEE